MLQITTTPAKIGINNTKPIQSIKQPKGEQYIKQPKPEMIIDRELPKVLIDQYQCFAEAGLKNPTDLMIEIREWSRKKWLEGIERRCEEGNMLAQIEKGGNPIPLIAENRAFPVYDFNVDFIPRSRPKFEVIGHLKINWQINKPVIDYKPNKPVHNYQPGKVEVYIRQWPDIDIRFIDEKI